MQLFFYLTLGVADLTHVISLGAEPNLKDVGGKGFVVKFSCSGADTTCKSWILVKIKCKMNKN